MEQIVNNQAFEHIVEKIFLPLKYEDLVAWELVSKSAGTILKNPLFWLKKWKLKIFEVPNLAHPLLQPQLNQFFWAHQWAIMNNQGKNLLL